MESLEIIKPRRLRTPSAPTARRYVLGIGAGAWACGILAFLAFGGGLGLAFLGSDGSEAGPRVAGVASEILYTRPETAATSPKPTAVTEPAEASAGETGDVTPLKGLEGDSDDAIVSLWTARSPDTSELPLHDLQEDVSDGFALDDLGDAVGTTMGPAGGSLSESGSSALHAESIPEPSTWALMLSGLVALGARARSRRTRR